jgi:hypothetical protein
MAREEQANKGENDPIEIPAIEYHSQSTTIEHRQQTVELDQLGPIIINTDGTMQRITNWDKMTEQEKRNIMRIIPKRNAQRLAALQRDSV